MANTWHISISANTSSIDVAISVALLREEHNISGTDTRHTHFSTYMNNTHTTNYVNCTNSICWRKHINQTEMCNLPSDKQRNEQLLSLLGVEELLKSTTRNNRKWPAMNGM